MSEIDRSTKIPPSNILHYVVYCEVIIVVSQAVSGFVQLFFIHNINIWYKNKQNAALQNMLQKKWKSHCWNIQQEKEWNHKK